MKALEQALKETYLLEMAHLADIATASDEHLAKLLAEGGQAARRAFDALHDRYAQLVLAVVTRRLGALASGAASDVSQNVWLEVWNKTKTHYREQEKFGPWLLAIAQNRAIDQLRKKTPQAMSEGHEVAAPECGSEADEARSRALRGCIEALSPEHRQVDDLWLDQRSHQEIAIQLGIAAGTSMSRLGRAKHQLKNCIQSKLVS